MAAEQDPKASSEKPETKTAKNPELVLLPEIAKMLRMSPVQIRKMTQQGQIPAVKVDGEWRYNKDLVYQAVKRRSRGR
jgi:hypothetical protein